VTVQSVSVNYKCPESTLCSSDKKCRCCVCFAFVVTRDQLIEQLTWEVSQLRHELARVKTEDQMVIESLHNRVHELEMELSDLRQIAESTTTVCLHIHVFIL